ncbi:hypothetical protein [Moorena producens]
MQRIAIPYYLFPSWEGLGVGSCSLLPVTYSLKSRNCVLHSYENCYSAF